MVHRFVRFTPDFVTWVVFQAAQGLTFLANSYCRRYIHTFLRVRGSKMPPANLLETLQTQIPAMLSEAVRQDQRSPDFEISAWTVEKLSHKGVINPDGIFRFFGSGHDKQDKRLWTLILKVFDEPDAPDSPA